MLEKATAIKRFEYLLIGKELKKQTSIAKVQYNIFKDQMNISNNNREDGVKTEDGSKTEDGEIIGYVHHRYIGDKYKNLIPNIFTFGLKDGDFHLTYFDNQHVRLTDIINKCLKEKRKNIDVSNRFFNFKKPFKNLVNIDNKTNMVIDNYKPKTDTKYDNKERVV